ncbi:family 1 glycosylhydrolase [Streptomyces sp. NPDC091215]|uniref:family 1 glycosylhydrolase n=1 Tax=Streptomyces sp. NPDC091215 TaxID=3155192 RepID=UPI003421051E
MQGKNLNSDFRASDGPVPEMERGGDACDSYRSYREGIRPLADAGLTAYRFGIKWPGSSPFAP